MSAPRQRDTVKWTTRPKSQIYLAFEALTCSVSTRTTSFTVPKQPENPVGENEGDLIAQKETRSVEKGDDEKGGNMSRRSHSFYRTVPLTTNTKTAPSHPGEASICRNEKRLRDEVSRRQEERRTDEEKKRDDDRRRARVEIREAPKTSVGRLKQKFEMLALSLFAEPKWPKKIQTRCLSEPTINHDIRKGSILSLSNRSNSSLNSEAMGKGHMSCSSCGDGNAGKGTARGKVRRFLHHRAKKDNIDFVLTRSSPPYQRRTGRRLSDTKTFSKSESELALLTDADFTRDINSLIISNRKESEDLTLPRCKSLETNNNVFDRGKSTTLLRRSNSVDSRSSTLKSHTEGDYDSDLDVQQEYEAWSYIHNRAIENLESRDVKRQDVISEFIYTERTHVRNLTLLQVAYATPLKVKQILSPEVADRIFINLEELQRIHRSFSKKLRNLQIQKQNDYVKELGQCILDVIEKPKFSDAHTKYCANISDSLMVLKNEMKSPDFAAFLVECESNPKCRRMHLKELLPVPFQRITKYPLLLTQIQKYTPVDTPEHELLAKCLLVIKAICSNIDAQVAKADGLRIEKAVRSRLLAENLHIQLGDVIINMPLHWQTGDTLLFVNAVLFESVLVLLAGEKVSDDKMITKIELDAVHCRRDQSDLKKLYIISICNNEPNMYIVNSQSEEATCRLHDALNMLVNRSIEPTSCMELIEREVYTERVKSAASHSNSMEGVEAETAVDGPVVFRQHSKEDRSSLEQLIEQKDAEIFTLLRHKVNLMIEMHGSKIPRGTRDLITALNQLITDTKTLHKVSTEILESYPGQDKNEKSVQINQAYTSSISNIDSVLRVFNCESSEEQDDGTNQEIGPMRRASMFIANKFSRSRDDLAVCEIRGERKQHKKYHTKQRSNTQSPMRLSPKSSNESLNKVTSSVASCRLSTCSHHSTDSECDVDNIWTNAKPPSAPTTLRHSNNKKANKNSGLFNFRKSQYIPVEDIRPIITDPILQHTTNTSVNIPDGVT